MKVSLIDYTGVGNPDIWHAARVLVFTKNTRLNMNAEQWSSIQQILPEDLLKQLAYMADTIPSSWEFVNYTFAVEGVTRACTHQMVRTRTASFAQQSMRVTDMTDFTAEMPKSIEAKILPRDLWRDTIEDINDTYRDLIELGIEPQDARGILPTNIHTNIVCHYNLRTMSDLVKSRSGGRTQDEYRDVVKLMGEAILTVHPWANVFLYPKGVSYFDEIEQFASDELVGPGKMKLLKIVDKMRKE